MVAGAFIYNQSPEYKAKLKEEKAQRESVKVKAVAEKVRLSDPMLDRKLGAFSMAKMFANQELNPNDILNFGSRDSAKVNFLGNHHFSVDGVCVKDDHFEAPTQFKWHAQVQEGRESDWRLEKLYLE